MSNLALRIVMCLVFTLTVSATVVPAVAQTLVADDNLRFPIHVEGMTASAVTFSVFSRKGVISKPNVLPLDIKGPEGQSLPLTALSVSAEPNAAAPSMARVSLSPMPQFFVRPGEYKVSLLFRDLRKTGAEGQLRLTCTLVKASAELNVAELQDQTVELVRSYPGGTAEGGFKFYVRETTGQAQVIDLRAFGQNVLVSDSKLVVPGVVKAEVVNEAPSPAASPTPSPTATPEAKGETEDTRVPEQLPVAISFSGLERTGDFSTRVILRSASFQGEKIIPLKVRVKDRWGWPLLVIFLGVCGGFLTSQYAGSWRPRRENELVVTKLRGEFGNALKVLTDPQRREQLQALLSRLRAAEADNRWGTASNVSARLKTLGDDWAAVVKAEAARKAEARSALESLKEQLDSLELQPGQLDEPEKGKLNDARERLGDAERFLWEGRVDDAEKKLESARVTFVGVARGRLQRQLTELDTAFASLGTATELERKAEVEARNEVLRLLASGRIEEARVKLEVLRGIVEAASRRRPEGALKGRGSAPKLATRAAAERPQPRATFVILPRPAERTSDEKVSITIHDEGGLLREGDELLWNFGDASPLVRTAERSVLHTYAESGDYVVRVEVFRGGSEVSAAVLREVLTVLPGAAESEALRIGRRLWLGNLLLSLLALALASVTGLLLLYAGKPFGTLTEYLTALLWGFGVDTGLKGFATVAGQVRLAGGEA